jgi:hypothetical protein
MNSSKKRQVFTGLISAALFCILTVQCSDMMSFGPDELIGPPLPITKSILPINLGNTWRYFDNVYDSLETPLYAQATLRMSIPVVFGVQADTQLIRVTHQNVDSTYTEYLYGYTWNESTSGLLIAYRYKNVTTRGVYITGSYSDQGQVLFDTAQLWFAYPASKGFTYHYNPDRTGDTSKIRTMEIISIDEPYYFPDQDFDNVSGLRFVNCYVYKETFHDTLSYYYIDSSETYGTVAYQQIYKGKVLRSYILQSLDNDWYGAL